MKPIFQKNRFIFSGVLLIFLSFLVFSCKSIPDSEFSGEIATGEESWKSVPLYPPAGNIIWKEIRPGIREFSYSVSRKTPEKDTHSKNGKLNYRVIELDFEALSDAGVEPEFFVKKPSGTKYWDTSESVKSFAKHTGSFIATNTNPFHIRQHYNPLSQGHILGICIENGKIYSEPDKNYCGIAFYKEENAATNQSLWRAQIFDRQTEILKSNDDGDAKAVPECACGGFWTILDKGEIREFHKIWDTRNAVATKNDGKTVLFLAGEALTFMETAEIFKALGAQKAMQFDGGNSTALYAEGKLKFSPFIHVNVLAILGIKLTGKN